MHVRIAYGRKGLLLDAPEGATIVEQRPLAPVADERAGFLEAVRRPVAARALRELAGPADDVVIVTSDVTRATPNERLIPWILDELAHVPPERITVIIGTGSHRLTTPDEMRAMFGEDVLRRVRVVDHDAHDPEQSAYVGTTSRGARAYLSKAYLAATVRIVVGFIEPHFYAGYSGGPKGVMPGVAGIETVTFFHNAQMIGDPRTRFMNLEDNPVQAMSREIVAMAPPQFLVNVTLDRQKRITGFFCGDYLRAHVAGTEFCKRSVAVEVPRRYDVVVTTNGGYPLDQNLYQCGKGLTAAAGIVKDGGTIVMCAECSDGLPAHGNFGEIVRSQPTARALLDMIETPGYSRYDQWAAQSQAMVLMRARIAFKSSLPDDVVREALLEPVDDASAAVRDALARYGPGASCAILPEGPYTVPFVAETSALAT
jgi:nickel-dependent lactate racemase